ncbi:glycosyltransferase [Rhodocyclaceae bacterium SMB388]
MAIQAGGTKVRNAPDWVRVFDYCSKHEVDAFLAKSNFCFTHGGTGSIISALTAECKVAVMPRLQAYGEHNDDHQVEIAELFEAAGLVVFWRETMAVQDVLKRLEAFEPKKYQSSFESLRESVAADIVEFLGKR